MIHDLIFILIGILAGQAPWVSVKAKKLIAAAKAKAGGGPA